MSYPRSDATFNPSVPPTNSDRGTVESFSGLWANYLLKTHRADFSAVCTELQKRSAKRELEWNRLESLYLVLNERSENFEAALVQVVGNEVLIPCEQCALTHGPFARCITLEGYLSGSCACCYLQNKGADCTFRGRKRKSENGPAGNAAKIPKNNRDREGESSDTLSTVSGLEDMTEDCRGANHDTTPDPKSGTNPRKSTPGGGTGAEVIPKVEGEVEDKKEQPQDAHHHLTSNPRSGVSTRESSLSGGTGADVIPKMKEEVDEEVCSFASMKFKEEVGEEVFTDTSVKFEESEEQQTLENTEYSTHMFTANEQNEHTVPGSGTHIEGPLLHIQNTRRQLETLRVQLATIAGYMDNARKETENARREIENSCQEIEEFSQSTCDISDTAC